MILLKRIELHHIVPFQCQFVWHLHFIINLYDIVIKSIIYVVVFVLHIISMLHVFLSILHVQRGLSCWSNPNMQSKKINNKVDFER